MGRREITMINEVSDVKKLIRFVKEISDELSLPPDIVFNINLALEEAVSNVMMYAYDFPGNLLTLSAEVDNGIITFELKDKGKAFDPTTQIKTVDTTLPVEKRPIGGLGMFLVKKMMDDVTYNRYDDTNILTIRKKIG